MLDSPQLPGIRSVARFQMINSVPSEVLMANTLDSKVSHCNVAREFGRSRRVMVPI
jgi:hypothetical protein